MIVGLQDGLNSIASYWSSRVSSEGALWIVMVDGLFLIPLVFAAFFYPGPVLLTVGAVVVVTVALIEAVHIVRTRKIGWQRR